MTKPPSDPFDVKGKKPDPDPFDPNEEADRQKYFADLNELREQWRELSQIGDTPMSLPQKALEASVRDLAGELLKRTEYTVNVTYDSAYDLAEAIRLTVEYVGNDLLPAQAGWSWFDALVRYDPKMVQPFLDKPIHFPMPPDSTEPVLFTGPQPPSTLSEVIGQGVGAGSVCWEDMGGTGVFKSQRASTIVNEMISWIERNYTLNPNRAITYKGE